MREAQKAKKGKRKGKKGHVWKNTQKWRNPGLWASSTGRPLGKRAKPVNRPGQKKGSR